jgi:hypothetical protein
MQSPFWSIRQMFEPRIVVKSFGRMSKIEIASKMETSSAIQNGDQISHPKWRPVQPSKMETSSQRCVVRSMDLMLCIFVNYLQDGSTKTHACDDRDALFARWI